MRQWPKLSAVTGVLERLSTTTTSTDAGKSGVEGSGMWREGGGCTKTTTKDFLSPEDRSEKGKLKHGIFPFQ